MVAAYVRKNFAPYLAKWSIGMLDVDETARGQYYK